MAARSFTALLLLVAPVIVAGSQSWKQTAPESFVANAQVTGGAGGVAAVVNIHIDRYTADAEHEALISALKAGDHPAFVEALRNAPKVGEVKVGDRMVAIRWARQRAETYGRRIALVTDAPLFFAGAGAADAQPTEGFDIAVAEFTVDSSGFGKGTMAAAARVKPGATGIQLDDYAGKRMTLVTVTRKVS